MVERTFLVKAEGFSINTNLGIVFFFLQASMNETLEFVDSPLVSTLGIFNISYVVIRYPTKPLIYV